MSIQIHPFSSEDSEDLNVMKLISQAKESWRKESRKDALVNIVIKICRKEISELVHIEMKNLLVEMFYRESDLEIQNLAMSGLIEYIERNKSFAYDIFADLFIRATKGKVHSQVQSIQLLTSIVNQTHISSLRVDDTVILFTTLSTNDNHIDVLRSAVYGLFSLTFSAKIKVEFTMELYLRRFDKSSNNQIKAIFLEYMVKITSILMVPNYLQSSLFDIFVAEVEQEGCQSLHAMEGIRRLIVDFKYFIPTEDKLIASLQILLSHGKNCDVELLSRIIDSLMERVNISLDLENVDMYLDLCLDGNDVKDSHAHFPQVHSHKYDLIQVLRAILRLKI